MPYVAVYMLTDAFLAGDEGEDGEDVAGNDGAGDGPSPDASSPPPQQPGPSHKRKGSGSSHKHQPLASSNKRKRPPPSHKKCQQRSKAKHQRHKRNEKRPCNRIDFPLQNYSPPRCASVKYSYPDFEKADVEAKKLPAAQGAYVGAGKVKGPTGPASQTLEGLEAQGIRVIPFNAK